MANILAGLKAYVPRPFPQLGQLDRYLKDELARISALSNDIGNTAARITCQIKTVSSLPTASLQQGARYMVSDATVTTFWTVVVGGGANLVPVTSDGTNWRIG